MARNEHPSRFMEDMNNYVNKDVQKAVPVAEPSADTHEEVKPQEEAKIDVVEAPTVQTTAEKKPKTKAKAKPILKQSEPNAEIPENFKLRRTLVMQYKYSEAIDQLALEHLTKKSDIVEMIFQYGIDAIDSTIYDRVEDRARLRMERDFLAMTPAQREKYMKNQDKD